MAILDHLKKQLEQFVKPIEGKLSGPLEDPEALLRRPQVSLNSSSESSTNRFRASVKSEQAAKEFQETSKQAYTHGFENIYSLESVDISTVRRIGEQRSSTTELLKKIPEQKQKTQKKSGAAFQQTLNLGVPYRGWIHPYVLNEPIKVLELNPQAERVFIDTGRTTLKDLRGLTAKDLAFIKGMGQGHIDEMQQKLERYLQGRELSHCHSIDFDSLLRCLLCGEDRLKIFASIEGYGFADRFPLSSTESMTWRRLSEEKRKDLQREGIKLLQSERKQKFLQEKFSEIVEAFLKPWMRGRQGMATYSELKEYLERLSGHPVLARSALSFFQDIYQAGAIFSGTYFIELDPLLFGSDVHVESSYKRVVEQAEAYFYRPDGMYALSELMGWMERENACDWVSYSKTFVEKALRLSPHFRVRKGLGGGLVIRLA